MNNVQGFFRDLVSVKETFGPESVVGFISSDMTNEAAYLFQKFFRTIIGSNNIFSVSGPESPWTPLAVLKDAMGVFNMTPSLTSIGKTNMIIVVDISSFHSLSQYEVLSVIDPLKNKKLFLFSSGKSIFESVADVHFQMCPEGIAEVLRALLWEVHYFGATDREVLWKDNSGFQQLLRGLRSYQPVQVSKRWGISEQSIHEAALTLSHQRSMSLIFCDNEWPDYQVTRCCKDALNLLMAMGHMGRTGSGFYYLPARRNVIGVSLMGCSPSRLPGYLPLDNESAYKWLESSWGSPVPSTPGITLNDFFRRLEIGKIKSVLFLGDDFKDIFLSETQYSQLITKVKLFAGAGTVLEPHAHYWWPLVPMQHRSGSLIRFDRKLIRMFQDQDNEDQNDNISGFQDWEILSAWMNQGDKTSRMKSDSEIQAEIRTVVPGLISMNLGEESGEDIYFLSVSPEITGILEHDFEMDDIPMFSFRSVPEPVPLEDKDGIISIVFRSETAGKVPDTIKKWLTGLLPIAVITPEDAQKYNIKEDGFMKLQLDSGCITVRFHVGNETYKGCITAWIPQSSEFRPPLPDKEVFLRIRSVELEALV